MTEEAMDTTALVLALRDGGKHLRNMAQQMEFPWRQEDSEPRLLHNMYARCLVASYASKYSDLAEGAVLSLEKENYLVFALCGRALIENTATLRYYMKKEYEPLLNKGPLSRAGITKLIDIDDRHLRGARFDWTSFFMENYASLRSGVVADLEAKKKKKAHDAATKAIINPQINVLTCIEHWARDEPNVMVVSILRSGPPKYRKYVPSLFNLERGSLFLPFSRRVRR